MRNDSKHMRSDDLFDRIEELTEQTKQFTAQNKQSTQALETLKKVFGKEEVEATIKSASPDRSINVAQIHLHKRSNPKVK